MPLEDPDKKPPMKPEELNMILIIGGILFLYIVPTIILMIFRAGAREYLVAFTIFMIMGMIFWHAGAVLRD
ncbi:hypothetical protein KKD57_02665 [Patescibacteria group bacterium]|nr:hypothetical protein [Patescibacteria group bacterium]